MAVRVIYGQVLLLFHVPLAEIQNGHSSYLRLISTSVPLTSSLGIWRCKQAVSLSCIWLLLLSLNTGTFPLAFFFFMFLFLKNYFMHSNWRLITLQNFSGFPYTQISHRCTHVTHPEPPSHLPPHPIPEGHPSAPALSTLSHASNLDWWSSSHMVIYIFQCYSLKSSHPCLLPQGPKVCSLHLCLFCCLTYRIIVTIFLNSIYMH